MKKQERIRLCREAILIDQELVELRMRLVVLHGTAARPRMIMKGTECIIEYVFPLEASRELHSLIRDSMHQRTNSLIKSYDLKESDLGKEL